MARAVSEQTLLLGEDRQGRRTWKTYREHQGGHRGQELWVDHGEDRRQVALPRSHEEQPVDGAEGN